ncbi:unnamed protein product [Cuscuta europaea]|uniref:Nuclease associated modular domain-containing protein n=2 Tax=Cuscuta europaea TaxID=41803 RepID=A0A9P0ZG69_CUSEU|nr:unnamed protein product [Cuscuta europaea]
MLNTHCFQASNIMADCTKSQLKLSTSLKNNSPLHWLSVSINVGNSNRAFCRSISLGETSMRCQAKCEPIGLSEEQSSNSEHQEDIGIDYTEILRRRKISQGNKGKEAWNKGRKHTAETREKIRMRTKEALSDPKIRKKMSECRRSLSKKTKMRMRSSLRKPLDKRLKRKRSREKFLQGWAESVAEAAKKGSDDQDELDWDSYDKIKREISLQQIHCAAEKAGKKERARLRAERAAQAKVEKMERRSQRKKLREERAALRRERDMRRRSKQGIENMEITEKLNLKARLMKIQKKESVDSHVRCQHQRAWEKLDIDFIQKEYIKKEVSLEDQILLAKKRRTESLNDIHMALPPHSVERMKDCSESSQTHNS